MGEMYLKIKDTTIHLRHNGLHKDRSDVLFLHGLGDSHLPFRHVLDKTREFYAYLKDFLG